MSISVHCTLNIATERWNCPPNIALAHCTLHSSQITNAHYILQTARCTIQWIHTTIHCRLHPTLAPFFLSVCYFFVLCQAKKESKIFFFSPGWNWMRFSTSPARRKTPVPVSCWPEPVCCRKGRHFVVAPHPSTQDCTFLSLLLLT